MRYQDLDPALQDLQITYRDKSSGVQKDVGIIEFFEGGKIVINENIPGENALITIEVKERGLSTLRRKDK